MKTLYHYCSNNSFYSIVTNNSIWLSSLSLSNDSMEGKLVSEILLNLAKDDNLNTYDITRLQDMVVNLNKYFDGLGFCLSENGDLLSQWRGYANDASGVSIGFSKEFIANLSKSSSKNKQSGFTLQKIEYDYTNQVKLIKPTYSKIKELIDNGAFKFPAIRGLIDTRNEEEIKNETEKTNKFFSELSFTVLSLFSKLFLLKTKGFREECEWRLISYFINIEDDHCFYRASNDRIIPYREYKLLPLNGGAITEIFLGPKNITPNSVIKSFLNQHGFTNTNILRSEATYR